MSQESIAFVGAGKMATALARGLVKASIVSGDAVIASDPSPAALDAFRQAVGGSRAADSNQAAAKDADTVLLAVKPQMMQGVLEDLKPVVGTRALVISIAAGVTIKQLSEGLGAKTRIIRVMPNTPCLVGRGASGFAAGERATAGDVAKAEEMLRAVGVAHQVAEPLLDAVTGLSGSGPAFVYTVIEAMSDAGVRAGLPRGIAADLAVQTVAGAAQMVLKTGDHPAELREAVTSPGGTTAAGLAELDRNGLRWSLLEAVNAAANRATELGKK